MLAQIQKSLEKQRAFEPKGGGIMFVPSIHIKSTSNQDLDLPAEIIEAFQTQLRGELVLPGDENYDEVRQLYNAMIDKRPAMVARCQDVADVMASVAFARKNNLLVAVRGGGHNGPGLALADDGLVVDLSAMKGIRVDPKKSTARVEPGAVWRDVDHATHAFGLAAVSGIISTTGVSGLTLGGGHGYLSRKYGLTIDNLLEADVVLADGTMVTASADANSDLFWDIRGGGGNFGIVTSFLFQLHPVQTVYAGPMLWPMEKAEKILRWYRDFLPSAPEDLYGFFTFMTVPSGPPFPEHLHGRKVCGVVWSYTGPLDKVEEIFRPIREIDPPILDLVGPMPYPVLQGLHDAIYPPGNQWYWKGDFVKELSDEAVKRHVEYGRQLPTPQATMHLYPIDGAVHRVGKKDTAFSYRDVTWSEVIVGVDPDPANNERMIAWADAYWEALHPFAADAGGGYVNFMMEEGQERVQATYQENHARLVEIKKQYDPDNFFHINQNIRPAG